MAGSETRRGGGSEEGVGQVHVRMCLVHHAEFLSLKDWRPRKVSANHPVGSRKDGSRRGYQWSQGNHLAGSWGNPNTQ